MNYKLKCVQPTIHVQGLRKWFGAKVALARLDLQVQPGELLGLIGPTAAGKTTTLKLLLGRIQPTQGRANVLGFDCATAARELTRHIGYSPDDPGFYALLSGRETIDFTLRARGLERQSIWRALDPLVDVLGLGPQLDMLTSTYSLGMRKRLALLLALADEPRVLLLDQPTTGLDPTTTHAVGELLRRKAREGTAILLSTHQLDLADRLCTQLLVLNRGRVVTRGTPAEVRTNAGVGADATLEQAFLRLIAA